MVVHWVLSFFITSNKLKKFRKLFHKSYGKTNKTNSFVNFSEFDEIS